MTLYLSEGWDMYSNTAQVFGSGRWQSPIDMGGFSSLFTLTPGADPISGPAMVISPSSGTVTSLATIGNLFSSGATVGGGAAMTGFWMKASNPSTYVNSAPFFGWLGQGAYSGPSYYSLVLSSLGFIGLTNLGATPPFILTAVNVMDNNWHWIDYKQTNGGTGATLYVDNVRLINSSGGSNLNFAQYGFAFAAIPGVTLSLGDMFAWTDVSATYPSCAAFPAGTRYIFTARPVADSSVSFTRSSAAASNASLVAQSGLSTTTGYVQSSALGNRDLYTYSGPAAGSSSIFGAVVCSYLETATYGNLMEDQIALSSATLSPLSSIPAPGNPYVMQQPICQDPATSTNWLPSSVTAATWGIRLSTASS